MAEYIPLNTISSVLRDMRASSENIQEEAGTSETSTPAAAAAPPQDASTSTEANTGDMVEISRRSVIIVAVFIAIIIIILSGVIIFTVNDLNELTEQIISGLTGATKEFPSLSRKEGIVPGEVWNWIVAAKAHYLLRVSSDAKSLYQASLNSPPRVPTDQTYLVCICVSSKYLLNTRSYYELRVTQRLPWTLGFRTESFDADTTPDTHTDGGIWTIASEGGRIIINNDKVTPTLHITPTKLGLYLDYSRGQVSFYDPGFHRHLHTYLTTFKEKLRFYASVQVQMEETQEVLISFV